MVPDSIHLNKEAETVESPMVPHIPSQTTNPPPLTLFEKEIHFRK